MSPATPEPNTTAAQRAHENPRPCAAPADLRAEVARYDAAARAQIWDGPRYRMTYRGLGEGPALVLVPGIASTYRSYSLLLNRLAEHFRTIVYDYPGERRDGAHLARISHDDLVDDLVGLIDHLNLRHPSLLGISFGSTVVLKAAHGHRQSFGKSAVQGGFAHREFTIAERFALSLGQLVPGTVARLPMRRAVLTYNSRTEFPPRFDDRFRFYLEENARTPIRSLAHRVHLLTRLDLLPILREIELPLLLIQGNEDRIVPRRHFDVLEASLLKAEGVILPLAGHQTHLTHAEVMAQLVRDWVLACGAADGRCPGVTAGAE
jgi:pimeloyl-ACP methyl ester carboxylesterase